MILECNVPHSSTPDAFDIFAMASSWSLIENLQVQGYDIVHFYDRYTKVSDLSILVIQQSPFCLKKYCRRGKFDL